MCGGLIAGRFDSSQPANEPFRTSPNQTFHFLSDRYTEDDLISVPPGEIIIIADGELILSGTDGVEWET